MPGTSDDTMFGLKSTPQAVLFGLGCAAIGALAATLSWNSLSSDTVSPRLVENNPPSLQPVDRRLVNSNAGTPGQVSPPTHQHSHDCEDCAFCRARAQKAQQAAAAPFVPLHQRPEYTVESPDVLKIRIVTVNHSIDSELRVHPDGCLALEPWDKLHVAGKTVAAIKHAIAEHLADEAGDGQIDVSVAMQNSRAYYVLTDFGPSGHEEVARRLVHGNETVLDAIASAGRLNEMGKKRIWIARPTAGGTGTDTIIPIRWQWSNPSTLVMINPGLLPGDRVFIHTPPSWMAFLERAGKLARTHSIARQPAGDEADSRRK